MDTLYPGFRYIETGDTLDPSDREAGEAALWRRSSVPLLPGWATDHRPAFRLEDTGSVSSSVASQQQQLEQGPGKPPARPWLWSKALVRLRHLTRNRVSDSGARDNGGCARLSTHTTVEEDFV